MNKSEWLAHLSDTNARIILGQHLSYLPADYASGYTATVTPLKTAYGKRPMTVGFTLGLGAPASTLKAGLDYLKARDYELIFFDHHPNNPWTGGDPWDTSVSDMDNLNTNTTWIAELDKLVEVFLYAKSLGMVGIWRPLHEMNGNNSFWWDWGCAGERVTPFKNAWHFMREYLDFRGVDNLLWCYSVLSMGWTDLYTEMAPASDEYELVGLDLYSDTATIPTSGYTVLTSLGKPFGFSEAGPNTSATMSANLWLDAVLNDYPATRYIQFWHSWSNLEVALTDMNDDGTFINNTRIMTLEDTTPSGVAYTKRRLTGFMSKPQFLDQVVIRGDTNVLTTFDFPQVYETISQAALTIREEIDADDVTLQLYATMTSGQFNLGKYTLTITLNPDNTVILVPGEYVYDCKLTVEGQTMTVARGKFTVIGDVYNVVSSD